MARRSLTKRWTTTSGQSAALHAGLLSALAVRNYSPETIEGRRSSLESFIDWCQERALLRAESISKRILESYQRALHRYRKANGNRSATAPKGGT